MTFSGTWYILPTTFTADGELDTQSLHTLVDAAIGWGVDGLVAMGIMGEPASLSDDERELALRAIIDAAGGRVPVAVGCSSSSAGRSEQFVAQARRLGAAGVMAAAPPLARNVDLLPAFFRTLAQGGLPVIIQDEPAATGVLIPVSVLVACAAEARTVTIKLEDPPTPPKITRLLDARADLMVFGGLGGTAALSELRRGACGTMTGFAYPEVLRAIRTTLDDGRAREAALLFDRYLPLIQFEAQQAVGLGIRKEILRRRGVIATSHTRGVGGSIDRRTGDELTDVLERLGIDPGPSPLLT